MLCIRLDHRSTLLFKIYINTLITSNVWGLLM